MNSGRVFGLTHLQAVCLNENKKRKKNQKEREQVRTVSHEVTRGPERAPPGRTPGGALCSHPSQQRGFPGHRPKVQAPARALQGPWTSRDLQTPARLSTRSNDAPSPFRWTLCHLSIQVHLLLSALKSIRNLPVSRKNLDFQGQTNRTKKEHSFSDLCSFSPSPQSQSTAWGAPRSPISFPLPPQLTHNSPHTLHLSILQREFSRKILPCFLKSWVS